MRYAIIACAVLALPVVAAAQTPLRAGETVSGQLSASDPVLQDGSHYDCYAIQVPAGQGLTVTQRSSAFDSYLAVGQGRCGALTGAVTNDDMPGGGLDSQVSLTSTGGTYMVQANSLAGGATGAYTIQATVGAARAAPSAPAASASASTDMFAVRLTPVPAPGPNGVAPMTFDRAVECGAIWLVRFMMPDYAHHPRDTVENFRSMAMTMLDRAAIEGRAAGRTRQEAQDRMAETAALLQMQVDAAGTYPEGMSPTEVLTTYSDTYLARSAVAVQWEPYENGCVRDSVRR